MKTCICLFVSMALLFCFCVGNVPAQEYHSFQETTSTSPIPGGKSFFDFGILRPIGVVACVAGLAGSIIAAPLMVATGQDPTPVLEGLFVEPLMYTFRRDVGDIEKESWKKTMMWEIEEMRK